MRYYRIDISDAQSGTVSRSYTSYVNGQTDPGALLVEIDVLVGPLHLPVGNSFVRVWGVSLRDIGQASNLNGMRIAVYGGMQKGLPLANPQQAGLLFQGTINQAFGNWQGTSQSLDLLVIAAPPVIAAPNAQSIPLNLSVNWEKGTTMASMIAATLTAALPSFQQSIQISPKLVFPEGACGYYATLTQFASMVNSLSRNIIGGSYAGVTITIDQQTIKVADGTVANSPKSIAFNDLIGQITWIGPGQLSAKCVMRADIAVNDTVTLPPGQITTTAASLSQYRQGSVFQGNYGVKSVRHVGNSRQPDANAWVTVFELYPAAAA